MPVFLERSPYPDNPSKMREVVRKGSQRELDAFKKAGRAQRLPEPGMWRINPPNGKTEMPVEPQVAPPPPDDDPQTYSTRDMLAQPKRRRGRPRKNPLPDTDA